MRIRLVVLENDAEFLRHLAQYIRQSDFSHQFAVKTFSDSVRLQRFLFEQAGTEEIDVLLAAPHLLEGETFDSLSFPVVKLLENPYLLEQGDGEGAHKFQPLRQLLAKLISVHMQHVQTLSPLFRASGQKSGKVIAVFSAAGGCGKTTVAFSLARQLVLLQKRVLYVNFETLPATHLLFSENDQSANDNFARLMYCLKTKPEQLRIQLPSFVRCDPVTQIHYIASAEETKELLDMNREDVLRLVQELSAGMSYDIVLLDLESIVHDRIIGSLQASDRILWIVNDDARCLYKTDKWVQSSALFFGETMSLSGKTHFVLNKSGEVTLNDFSERNIHIEGQLPFVPEWQTIKSLRNLLQSGVFNERLIQLSHRLDLIGKEVKA